MSFLSSIKSVVKWMFPWSEERFYPLTNTNYSVSSLTRWDYLRLYTWRQYVAVSTIANSLAELERQLTRNANDDKQIEHKHFQLLTYELLVQIVSSLQLTGSCYLYKNKIWKTIDSLDFLRTDLVTIEQNSDWSVSWYTYNAQNKNYKFAKEDIIDISLFSPLKTYPFTVKWVSPMQAVAIQAEMDNTANHRNRNFFKNWASAGDIFSTENPIKEEVKSRFVNKRKSEFQWVNNSHKVALLDNGLKYEKVWVTQKELDFVESRRFTRDEVFAIFKVPKTMVGIDENANRASSLVAETTFYRICIKPLARMLQEVFNRELFQWVGYFQFVNIVPTDNESLLNDLNAWAITINEYRKERWRERLQNADVLKLSPLMFDTENQFQLEQVKSNLWEFISKSLKKNIKWTEEYRAERQRLWQKKREAKIQRTDKYEAKYEEEINKLFADQKNQVVQQIMSQKWMKKINRPTMDNLMNTAKRVLWLSWVYQDVFQAEWTHALSMIGLNTVFQTGNPKANKRIRDNIVLVAKEVDKHTKSLVFDTIASWNDAWLWAEEIAKQVDLKLQEFSKSRAKTIARTEITRASTEAEVQAFEQSWIVQWKERYTADDEKTCPECNSMDWKVLWLRENYVNKWDTHRWIEYDYADVNWPALHPNCRCTLLPVL